MKLLSKARTTLEKTLVARNSLKKELPENAIWAQPNWDELFMVLGLAYFKPEKAIILFEENLSRLPSEKEPETSQSVQNILLLPPLHGYLLNRIYELIDDKAAKKAFLERNYSRVLAFHRYLYAHRDPREEGILFIRHPKESGISKAPVWDTFYPSIAPKKGKEGTFAVQDPLFNALLVLSNEFLIKLGGLLKIDVLEVIHWNELTIYSLNEKLWEEERGIYNAYDLNADAIITVSSIVGILPLVGEVPTQDQAECILCTLESSLFGGKSNAQYLFPTNSMHTDSFAFQENWKGAVNMISNWMLVEGLLRYDMDELANKVKADMLEILSKYGFFEYYDPRKRGLKSIGYGRMEDPVSAAICIDLLMKEVRVMV